MYRFVVAIEHRWKPMGQFWIWLLTRNHTGTTPIYKTKTSLLSTVKTITSLAL